MNMQRNIVAKSMLQHRKLLNSIVNHFLVSPNYYNKSATWISIIWGITQFTSEYPLSATVNSYTSSLCCKPARKMGLLGKNQQAKVHALTQK